MLVTVITKSRNDIIHHSISLSNCGMDLGSVTKGIKEFVEMVTYFLIKEAIFISFVCLPGLDDIDNKSRRLRSCIAWLPGLDNVDNNRPKQLPIYELQNCIIL